MPGPDRASPLSVEWIKLIINDLNERDCAILTTQICISYYMSMIYIRRLFLSGGLDASAPCVFQRLRQVGKALDG